MFQRSKDSLLEIICYFALLIYGVTSDGFYIKKYPNHENLEEGNPMSFDCLAIPSDHIIYKWYHNEKPIVFNQHRYIGSDNQTLVFNNVDRDIDPGKYYCLAQNSSSRFTRKSRTGALDVNWFDPVVTIKMIEPKSASDIKLGVRMSLKCDGMAFPKIAKENIKWYFNGISDFPNGMKVAPDGTLQIDSIGPTHLGFLNCFIFHKAGKLDSLTPFIIDIDDKSLIPDDFTNYAKPGTQVKLTCPWSKGTVSWSKMQRLGDPLQEILPQSKEEVFVIPSMSSNSDSYYICKRVQKEGSRMAIFRVSLAKMYDFEPKQFSPRLGLSERLIVREGEHGEIRYYLDLTPSNNFIFDRIPNPVPTITWEYNSEQILEWNSDSNIPPPRRHVLRNRHLIIKNATKSDRGIYRIKMENLEGQRIREFKVEVTFPPTFLHTTEDDFIIINEDDSRVLDCKINEMSAEDTVKVYWKKDGIAIASYMEGLTYEDNGKKLRIDRAKSEHSGVYQCFVKTIGFPETFNRRNQVTVKAKLQIIGLDFDVFLEVNKNGTIHCKTKGYGKINIMWYYISYSESDNGRPIRSEISYPHYILKNGTLILKNVQKIYSGDYMCVAESYETREVINRTMKVKVGEKPKIITITSNVTSQEGSTFYLDCVASGDPKPTISWFMDNSLNQKQLMTFDSTRNQNERKQVLKNGTLVIRNAGLTDEAKYTCFATNTHFIAAEDAVIVKVLTPEEYSKLKLNNSFNKGMLKTIIIVVSCALAYLALIIGLTAFCSLRMLRHRRNRSTSASNMEKLGDNSQLMRHIGGSNPNGGSNSNEKMLKKSSRTPPNSSVTNNNLPKVPFIGSHGYYTQCNALSMPNYLMNPLIDSHGSEFQHLMSAPPPTPLESRSNFSGNMSSTNSASIYTKSHFSSSTNGGLTGVGMNSMERLTYPRHELQNEGIIGKGEFGDVILARARNILDGESQSLVVVKSLIRNDPSHYHEFHRQLDLLARSESDFVTKLLGICIEVEPYLLILEYCEWGDLKQFLQCVKDQPKPNMPLMNRQQKLSVCAQIATGMEHIAGLRCVHKDLAARNILVTPQLNIKISHLGLCRDIFQGEYYQDGDQILPIRWMPPESVLKSEFSLQSDVWSFAVTCWEIFALGSLPMFNYKNEEILDILASSQSLCHTKVQMMYSTLEQFPNECPQSLLTTVKRCLFIDPQGRPSFTEICKCFKDNDLVK